MIGISFHVGPGCMDAPIYAKAIQASRKIFNFAENVGFQFNLLDIGGGFPGYNNTKFQEVLEFLIIYFYYKYLCDNFFFQSTDFIHN